MKLSRSAPVKNSGSKLKSQVFDVLNSSLNEFKVKITKQYPLVLANIAESKLKERQKQIRKESKLLRQKLKHLRNTFKIDQDAPVNYKRSSKGN